MNIYVGNLPYEVTEGELESLFAEFGAVRAVRIITDFDTGRSKGFGFVEMDDDDQAKEAMSKLDGKDFRGRTLRVNPARPRGQGGGPRRY